MMDWLQNPALVAVVLALAATLFCVAWRVTHNAPLPSLDEAMRVTDWSAITGEQVKALLAKLENQLTRSPDLRHALREVASCAATDAFEPSAGNDFHSRYERAAIDSMAVALWAAVPEDRRIGIRTRSAQMHVIEGLLSPAFLRRAQGLLTPANPQPEAAPPAPTALDIARGAGAAYEISLEILGALLTELEVTSGRLRRASVRDFCIAVDDVAHQHGERLHANDPEARAVATDAARSAMHQILWEVAQRSECDDLMVAAPPTVRILLQQRYADSDSVAAYLDAARGRLVQRQQLLCSRV